jgi:hypothetical protein
VEYLCPTETDDHASYGKISKDTDFSCSCPPKIRLVQDSNTTVKVIEESEEDMLRVK